MRIEAAADRSLAELIQTTIRPFAAADAFSFAAAVLPGTAVGPATTPAAVPGGPIVPAPASTSGRPASPQRGHEDPLAWMATLSEPRTAPLSVERPMSVERPTGRAAEAGDLARHPAAALLAMEALRRWLMQELLPAVEDAWLPFAAVMALGFGTASRLRRRRRRHWGSTPRSRRIPS